MPHFDESKRYQAKEEGTFFDDGREIAVLHFIYGKPDIEEIRGSPQRVLAAIDEYARTQKYLMNVGEQKGKIVTDLIAERKPQTMIELGGYVGYSTILFGEALKRNGGKRYYSLEKNPEFGAVIASLVDLAGLSDIVKVVVGSSDISILRLAATKSIEKVELMFLDHYKPAYTADLKLCEELGLIGVGTVLAADNVIAPGNPPYLDYVRSTVAQKRSLAQNKSQGSVDELLSRFQDHTLNQYQKRDGSMDISLNRNGNPNIVYKSELVDGFEPSGEPDGVEITRCVGIEE